MSGISWKPKSNRRFEHGESGYKISEEIIFDLKFINQIQTSLGAEEVIIMSMAKATYDVRVVYSYEQFISRRAA